MAATDGGPSGRSAPPAPGEQVPLRVVSWNTCSQRREAAAGGDVAAFDRRKEADLQAILARDPDVVALQDVGASPPEGA